MDGVRDFSAVSVDEIEQRLVSDERLIARLRARQLVDLELLDSAQVFTADGVRNLSEWTAQKLDVSVVSSRSLVRTMRRTQSKPHLRQALSDGAITFDRAEALSKVEDESDLLEHLDISGVYRAAADQIEITSEDEARTAADQFLVMQPALDESWWKVFGGLDGVTGKLVDQALTDRADSLPELPDGERLPVGWRKAIALYELVSGGKSPETHITLFVDANRAVATNGRAGVRLEAGPRVGVEALEAVLCDSTIEVTVDTADGVPMKYGRTTRTIPPALRRAILATTAGHCAVDGCDSRYRVEVHHKTPYSEGGSTDPENLVPLCWFHHHIVIHQQGFHLHAHPEHGRWRLRKPRPAYDDEHNVAGASPGIRP